MQETEMKQKFYPFLKRQCQRLLPREDGEEAANSALYKVLTGLATYQPEKGGIYNWMAHIAQNQARDMLRQQKKQLKTRSLAEPGMGEIPIQEPWGREPGVTKEVNEEESEGPKTRAFLRQLSPGQRTVLCLRARGSTFSEIAQMTGRKISAVKMCYQRTLRGAVETAKRSHE